MAATDPPRVIHTGEGYIRVPFDVDELLELAACTGNKVVRERLLKAAALLDQVRADEVRKDIQFALGDDA